jgi:CheY-like chemotaxis protein/HPt (histidine-containing phosphotransfer) domain-containing protein
MPLRILVVEDVAVNQKFALLALEEMGYRAEVAGNGLEALNAVTRQPYDVLLMDVQMPEMDGLEATRRIHQLWENGDLAGLPTRHRPHIIAMTANALQGDREICLEAGMDDYVSKPIYLSELRAALERAGQTQSRRANGASPAQPPATEAASTLPVDPATLAKTLKRRQGLETINLYLTEARTTLEALQTAVVQQDARAVQELAHSLKGSSRYMGAAGVAALSESLEQQGRRGALAGAPVLLNQLLAEFERVQQQLEQ